MRAIYSVGMARVLSWTLTAYLLTATLPAASAQPGSCPCDCNADDTVDVAEIITATNVALGNVPVVACPAADFTGDGAVDVSELIAGINAALDGCPRLGTPTATAPATATTTATGTAPPTSTATPTATVPPTLTATTTPTPIVTDPDLPPTDAAELLPWLQAGRYKQWAAESEVHQSGGPHFGQVRTYVNGVLFESLGAGLPSHPAGAAAVKELYGPSVVVRGWSVSVKVQAESAGGAGWYWYERFDDAVFGNGVGDPTCIGCHGRDFGSFTSKDFVLAPFPLQ